MRLAIQAGPMTGVEVFQSLQEFGEASTTVYGICLSCQPKEWAVVRA